MADPRSIDFVQDASLGAVLESARELAEQSPEAFGRLVVEILCKLASLDHEAYEFFLSRVISRELRAAGLSVVLAQAEQAIAAGQTEKASERLNAIKEWVSSLEYAGSTERVVRAEQEKENGILAERSTASNYVM